MDYYDLEILSGLVEDYPINDFIASLEKIVAAQADKLVDQGLGDKAKDLTLVAWHLHLLTGSQE
jgi:hypothetical protein